MPKTKKVVTAEVSSGNVFADLGLPNAEELNTKLRLCFVINKIRGWSHRFPNKTCPHSPAGGSVLFNAEDVFQPISGWRAYIELRPMQKIALGNDTYKRPLAIDYRQTALVGFQKQMRGIHQLRARLDRRE